jgi:hypothetical protein
MKKWLIGWSIAGLVAPVLYLTIYFTAGYTLEEGIFVFWPGAMGLMVLENQPPITTVVLVWLVLIASNVLVYALFGLLLWPLARIRSKGSYEEENRK